MGFSTAAALSQGFVPLLNPEPTEDLQALLEAILPRTAAQHTTVLSISGMGHASSVRMSSPVPRMAAL